MEAEFVTRTVPLLRVFVEVNNGKRPVAAVEFVRISSDSEFCEAVKICEVSMASIDFVGISDGKGAVNFIGGMFEYK